MLKKTPNSGYWNNIFCMTTFFTDTDDCASEPCEHGSCTDGVDSFTCSCDEGYEGPLCEIGECVFP